MTGPSGCGKTTLLHIIAGLAKPGHGSIIIDDNVVSANKLNIAPHMRGIGYVFQSPALWPHMTVEQNILYATQSKGIDIEGILDAFEISKLTKRYPSQISGGRDGVYLIDPQSGDVVREIAKDIQMTYTAGMRQMDDGSILIGHENGVTIFNDEVRIDFESPDIPSGRVNTLINDGTAGVWAGVQTGAVHFIKKDGSYIIEKLLTPKDGLKEDAVNAIALREDGSIWFGAYLANKVGGISILKLKQTIIEQIYV